MFVFSFLQSLLYLHPLKLEKYSSVQYFIVNFVLKIRNKGSLLSCNGYADVCCNILQPSFLC
jgi:hypothetical protein